MPSILETLYLILAMQFCSPISKDDAIQCVRNIIEDKQSSLVPVPFKKFQSSYLGAHLKSKQYEKYFVLCYSNSTYYAGRIVCPYVLSGFCPIGKRMMEIDTKKVGLTSLAIILRSTRINLDLKRTYLKILTHGVARTL